MGDLQDPKMEVITVPYVWPYELWGYPLKIRPSKIGQKYMLGTVGTSNQSVPVAWPLNIQPGVGPTADPAPNRRDQVTSARRGIHIDGRVTGSEDATSGTCRADHCATCSGAGLKGGWER